MNVSETYELLAQLLAYPSDETVPVLNRCRSVLRGEAPEAADWLDRFGRHIESLATEDLQELYTRTFDLNPVCSLEVGWQLFGENYSRGEFLVAMRQTLRRLNVPESTELPDHLTHVLTALGRMPAQEADRFASSYLLPALARMLQGLSGKNCPYECILAAIQALVLSPGGAALEEAIHG